MNIALGLLLLAAGLVIALQEKKNMALNETLTKAKADSATLAAAYAASGVEVTTLTAEVTTLKASPILTPDGQQLVADIAANLANAVATIPVVTPTEPVI